MEGEEIEGHEGQGAFQKFGRVREGCGVKGEVFNGPGSLALGGSGNPAKACGGKAVFLNLRE